MIITKRAIKKQIAKLEDYILEYKDQIDHLCDEAEKAGFIVLKDGDFIYVYYSDYTQAWASCISCKLSYLRGSIDSLQLSIDNLRGLL